LRQHDLLSGQLGLGLRHLGARAIEALPGRLEAAPAILNALSAWSNS